MNKKMIALGVAVAMAAMTGCVNDAEKVKSGRFISGDYGSYFENDIVVVDTETGVQYLWVRAGYAGGLTPILNPDGTPMIAEGYETEVVE